MVKGTYVKGNEVHEINEIHEIIRGNGLIELRPEDVEPIMKPIDALFYFLPKRERKSHFKHNLLIILLTVIPVFCVPALESFIQSDAVFSAMCWATISWVGFVVYANIRRR